MSRKSENSAAGSAGDVELLSSLESSPRKLADLGTTGPFGDFSTDYSSCFILKVNNEWLSTEEEHDDEESGALRKEYLLRLKLIREKLAGIDIANKNYYNNCFGYPPHDTTQCRITEIFDNDENTKPSPNRYGSSGKSNEKSVSVENVTYENESLKIPKENSILAADGNHLFQNGFPNFKSKTMTNLDQDSENNFQIDIGVSMPPHITDTLKGSELDIKSIFSYDCLMKHDQCSATELLDLNYNPPKKRPCVRESTPKLVLSEGTIPLPYHIRVSLHEDISKAVKQASNECNLHKRIQGMIDHSVEKVKEEEAMRNEENLTENSKINVIPPKSTNESTEEFTENLPQNGVQKRSKKSTGNDNTYVLLLDTLTQSSSASPKSNVTLMTGTTATVESLSRLRKKRRIFLRTARNKLFCQTPCLHAIGQYRKYTLSKYPGS
ncbi:uncharacterized protein LOC109540750 isoform X2 [Dendroctonus ponderosae]|uniref:uncharacterized protein LOC109540750 isoform X2 n=1 Tax=Dendroctonus ponderosae TaxID=77166 RepID=UPI0020356B6E|nr:uncharacterized protein LOC109540750 isoform X2 [Dendroctonus ponderosae]